MLGLLDTGKRCIFIDETWLNELDFRRMKWRLRNETNSIPKKGISPRVSVIAAIDTNGEVYYSLTQVNTDTDVFLLFLKKLFDTLSAEDRTWKNNTVIVVDGASYHASEPVRDFICKARVTFVLSAPYSYETAPIELFFHLLKRTNLNPNRKSTGKK